MSTPVFQKPIPFGYLDTDTAMTANSDVKVATQKATKAYVDSQVSTPLTKATGAEVDTGTDDAKYVTPKAIEDSSYAKTSAIPVKASGAEVDTGTDDAKFVTAKAIVDSSLNTGWISAKETFTYASADAPTFVITVSSGAESKYTVSDRIKLTQTTAKYFIITAITDTTLTVYGGTDYTLANSAISANYYSHVKNPQGFPATPAKWSVSLTDTSQRSQGSVVSGTWYNPGSLTLTIPIGVWKTKFYIWGRYSSGGNCYSGLSTANNTAPAGTLMLIGVGGASFGQNGQYRETPLTLASKQAYYVNVMTDSTGGGTLYVDGATTNTTVVAECAYL